MSPQFAKANVRACVCVYKQYARNLNELPKVPAAETNTDVSVNKSMFLRVATPFGGFEKAPRGITFKLPEVDLNAPRYPELQDPAAKRPTFNRTAQGGSPMACPSFYPLSLWSLSRSPSLTICNTDSSPTCYPIPMSLIGIGCV